MRDKSEGSLCPKLPEAKGQEGEGEVKAFDWGNRWLKGHEYEFILKNSEAYCQKFGFQKFSKKTHPTSIYERPISTHLATQTALCTLWKESDWDLSSASPGSSRKRNSVGKK